MLLCLFSGLNLFLWGQSGTVPDSLEIALENSEPNDSSRFGILLNLAFSRERTAPDQSVNYATQALDFALRINDTLRIAKAAQQLGNSFGTLGSPTRQKQQYLKALDLSRHLKSKVLESKILNNLGTVSLNEGNYVVARKYFQECLRVKEEIQYHHMEEAVYNNLGNLYSRLQAYDSALTFYGLALDKFQQTGHKVGQSIVLANIGNVYAMKNEAEMSLKFYRKCLPLKTETGDDYGLAELYYNLGNSFFREGQTDSAKYFLTLGLSLSKEISALEMEMICHSEMAKVYEGEQNYPKAYFHADRALILLDTLKDQEGVAMSQVTEMRFNAEQKVREQEFEAAKNALEQEARLNRQRLMSWVGLLCAGLFLILGVVLYRRYRERRQVAEILETRVQERTAELQATNEQLENSIAETERSKKDLNTFIYHSSHDLKSPLTSMLGLIDISEGMLDDHPAKKYLGMIGDRTRHLDKQLERLIEQVNLQGRPPRLEEFDLRELWGELMENLAEAPGFGEMKFDLECESPLITTDRDYLKLILKNLMVNAIDFRKLKEPGASCRVKLFYQNGTPFLTVTDQGIGISPEVAGRVWEMFYRGSNQSRGTGMGLYTVKTFVDLLGARIQFSSSEGQGTEFKIEFPKIDQKPI